MTDNLPDEVCSGAKECPHDAARKTKRKLTPAWEKDAAFEVPPAVRPESGEPRGPAHHTLFTPPGASDTTIRVRQP
jgi:hypothetical protein